MRNTWTREQLDMLERDYANTSTDLLSATFGKPCQQVRNKARELGLRKSPEYLVQMGTYTGGVLRWRNHA